MLFTSLERAPIDEFVQFDEVKIIYFNDWEKMSMKSWVFNPEVKFTSSRSPQDYFKLLIHIESMKRKWLLSSTQGKEDKLTTYYVPHLALICISEQKNPLWNRTGHLKKKPGHKNSISRRDLKKKNSKTLSTSNSMVWISISQIFYKSERYSMEIVSTCTGKAWTLSDRIHTYHLLRNKSTSLKWTGWSCARVNSVCASLAFYTTLDARLILIRIILDGLHVYNQRTWLQFQTMHSLQAWSDIPRENYWQQ